MKERREVELYANAKVGGGYNGYFKGGYEKGKAFLDTGKPQKGIVDEQEAKFRIRQFERKVRPTVATLMIHSLRPGHF